MAAPATAPAPDRPPPSGPPARPGTGVRVAAAGLDAGAHAVTGPVAADNILAGCAASRRGQLAIEEIP